MLPILATLGHGAMWLVTTMGSLLVWGFGISCGFWTGRLFTDKLDGWRAMISAKKLKANHDRAAEVMAAAVKIEQPATA